MSLATFKKKSINSASSATNISGKKSDKYWIYQGPYGRKGNLPSTIFSESLKNVYNGEGGFHQASNAGFSINGSHSINTYVGTTKLFSRASTPFRGQYPMGNGGTNGRYPSDPSTIVYNMPDVRAEIEGNDSYVRPSVLSNKGLLERRYRWINSGKYPNYWVQPIYTGNQTDTSSQGLYIQSKSAANDCWYDVNNTEQYVNYYVKCGPNGCQTTPANGYKMVLQQSNAPYTKTIHRPKDSSAYTLRIQRQCQNPVGPQKPFPYRVQTGTGVLRGGTSVSHVASACNTGPNYTEPPEWYIKTTTPPLTAPDPNSPEVLRRRLQNYIDVVLKGTTN
jgi:hypothetical protein